MIFINPLCPIPLQGINLEIMQNFEIANSYVTQLLQLHSSPNDTITIIISGKDFKL